MRTNVKIADINGIKYIMCLILLISVITLALPAVTAAGIGDKPEADDQYTPNTGQSPYQGPQTSEKKWNYTVDGSMSTPVVDVDGNIYFTSTNSTDENEQGVLYALDHNGKLKWKYTINNQFGSYAVFPPVIGPDDIIFFTNDLYTETGSHSNIYAIYPDGGEKWKYTITNFDNTITTTPPVIGPDGTIYFGFDVLDEQRMIQEGVLIALNPDGTKKWSFSVNKNTIDNSPAITPDGTIYTPASGYDSPGILYALNPEGITLWQFLINEGADNMFQSPPVIGSHGTIYLGAYTFGTDSLAILYALNPDGTQKWKKVVGNSISSPLALANDGTLYFSVDGLTLFAINSENSEIKWKFQLDNPLVFQPTIGSDGTVYFGGTYEPLTFYALNPNGTVKWTLEGVNTRSPAVIAPDGTLYFAAALLADNRAYTVLYAIQSTNANGNGSDNNSVTDPNNVTGAYVGDDPVGMQDTGLPLGMLALAVIMVLGGLFVPKRR